MTGLPISFPVGPSLRRFLGLQICFFAWGGYTYFSPYLEWWDSMLAALCQLNLFTTLIATFVLDEEPDSAMVNVMLLTMLLLPFSVAFLLSQVCCTGCWRAARTKAGTVRRTAPPQAHLGP